MEYKNDYETKMGIKYSKNGLVEFLETLVANESKQNKKDPKTAKLWEEKLSTPNLTMYLKKGGSEMSKDQPFLRSDITFPVSYKMQKLVQTVSTLY